MFVTILDKNDNIPKFSQALYTGSIMENSRARTTVDMVSTSKDKLIRNLVKVLGI